MYHIVLNPTSQSGRSMKIWKNLEPVFLERKIPHKLHYSEFSGHISQLVRQITEGLSSDSLPVDILILGGDGTLNEALQGVTDFSKINFGYIPTGSGNDFARDLHLPKKPREILEIILKNRKENAIRLLDLGVLHFMDAASKKDSAVVEKEKENAASTHFFAVSSGIGFDAAVCEEAMASSIKNVLNKLKLGKLTYLGIALKQLLLAKSVSCSFTLDDQKTIHLDRFLFIAAMLHQYEGGGFKFAPGADAADGILDLCVVGPISKPSILVALPTAFFGQHYHFTHVDPYQAKKIEIRSSAPLWVHTDGEVPARSSHIIISCRKQAIRLLL